eukprot:scaffold17849_cov27-Phaeocystis_antarctica.AAC.1
MPHAHRDEHAHRHPLHRAGTTHIRLQPAFTTYGCSLQSYGCSLRHLRLQPPSPTVAGGAAERLRAGADEVGQARDAQPVRPRPG